MICWAQRTPGRGPLVKWFSKSWGGPWVEVKTAREDKRRRPRKSIGVIMGRLEDKGVVARY